MTLFQQLGIGGDRPERLLQVVTGDIGELLQVGVRACQFHRPAGEFLLLLRPFTKVVTDLVLPGPSPQR